MMTTSQVSARPPFSLRSSKFTKPWIALLFIAVFMSMPVVAQVHFDRKADRIDIQVSGKLFSSLHFGKQVGKPYLHPLMTASGKAVTRGFPDNPLPGDSTDRPHLRGVIVGAEKLSAPSGGVQDFWENDPDAYYAARIKGNIVLQEATTTDGADRGKLSMVANWTSKQGLVWLIERRTMTFYTKPADSRMFDMDLEFEAPNEDVTFVDDKDVLIGVRLGLPFDTHYDGRLVNAAGGINEDGTRGQRSPWVDWVGDLGGEKVGVSVFDHPSNPHFPNRWHIRDFGQINVGPVGGKVFHEYASADAKAYQTDWSITVKRGEKLRVRYRILIHPAAGPAAGLLVSDVDRLLDKAKRPMVDQRVYDSYNEWISQK